MCRFLTKTKQKYDELKWFPKLRAISNSLEGKNVVAFLNSACII